LPPHVILPLASAAATGGKPEKALSVAAACGFLIVATRWFDDVQDRDRKESLWREVGPGRAVNLAATALTVAWSALAGESKEALHAFGRYTVVLARAQDLDLMSGTARTLDDYWQLMRGKTGAALALACEAGALAARPERVQDAELCGSFGEHLGVLMQILDDLDGAFHPDGIGDLAAGKVTLPVLYGLAIDHEAREELDEIVHCGLLPACAERALAILQTIDTREFLVWNALDERRRALACLDRLAPAQDKATEQGRDALRAFADLLIVNWEELAGLKTSAVSVETIAKKESAVEFSQR
jgi:geranylgeranyl pyrophosphate synthase